MIMPMARSLLPDFTGGLIRDTATYPRSTHYRILRLRVRPTGLSDTVVIPELACFTWPVQGKARREQAAMLAGAR